jgi:protocatechuate 3,4-dioxygenase beta subunit
VTTSRAAQTNFRREQARRTRTSRRAICFALALSLVALSLPTTTRAQETAASSSTSSRDDAARTRGSINVRVVDEANQPVTNATVLAIHQGQSSRVAYDNSGARSGKYVVSNLDAGVYRVTASAPGYVAESSAAAQDSDPFTAMFGQQLYRPGDSVTIRLVKGGVITGRVTDADGTPLVGARVTAVRVRDLAGVSAQDTGLDSFRPRERRTDDRGIYRLYGLSAGAYVVLAGGKPQFSFSAKPTAYDADAPTYYPSTTRDGAVELQLQAGQELTDIDIRYRGDRGHSVSGSLAVATSNSATLSNSAAMGGAVVMLVQSATGSLEGQTFIQSDAPTHTFSFDGIGDGEYDLTANGFVPNEGGTLAPPVHVSVRGADVTGVRLALAPLASLAGRVLFEPLKAADAAKPECQTKRAFAPQEMLLRARRDRDGSESGFQRLFANTTSEISPAASGDFMLRSLRDGRYQLNAQLADENFYVRSITLTSNAASAQTSASANTNTNVATANAATTNSRAATATTIDLARVGFTLKPGEKASGALITVAAGAATLRGRVAASEGEQLPDALRVYLVPAERERTEDVLRYSETSARAGGAFTFRNLAPGRYLLLARVVAEAEARQARTRSSLLDPNFRAALRRDAEAAKNSIELQPCQRAADFTLRFTRQ